MGTMVLLNAQALSLFAFRSIVTSLQPYILCLLNKFCVPLLSAMSCFSYQPIPAAYAATVFDSALAIFLTYRAY